MPSFSFFAFFADFLSNVNSQSVTKMAKNVTKCQFYPLQKINENLEWVSDGEVESVIAAAHERSVEVAVVAGGWVV